MIHRCFGSGSRRNFGVVIASLSDPGQTYLIALLLSLHIAFLRVDPARLKFGAMHGPILRAGALVSQ
jgi:hypothetical protein